MSSNSNWSRPRGLLEPKIPRRFRLRESSPTLASRSRATANADKLCFPLPCMVPELHKRAVGLLESPSQLAFGLSLEAPRYVDELVWKGFFPSTVPPTPHVASFLTCSIILPLSISSFRICPTPKGRLFLLTGARSTLSPPSFPILSSAAGRLGR